MLENIFECFSNNPCLAIFIVALFPTLESKIAIPFGLSTAIWGSASLNGVSVVLISFVGAILPALIIVPIFRFLRKKTCSVLCDKIINKVMLLFGKKTLNVDSASNDFRKCLLLAFFVAIPLPLTGVYSGSLIGALSNINLWKVFVSLSLGEVVSCLIMFMICLFFENSITVVLIVSIAMVGVYISGVLLKILLKRFCGIKKEKR